MLSAVSTAALLIICCGSSSTLWSAPGESITPQASHCAGNAAVFFDRYVTAILHFEVTNHRDREAAKPPQFIRFCPPIGMAAGVALYRWVLSS